MLLKGKHIPNFICAKYVCYDCLEKEDHKFPHKFNLPKNQNYIGLMPDKKYYDVDNMSESKLKDFEVFYAENKDKEFNFQKEIKSYFESDVDLLKTGCLSFRKIIKDLTKNEKFKDGIVLFCVQ